MKTMSEDQAKLPLEKIRDKELRTFAEGSISRRVSVLIEPSIPYPQVEVGEESEDRPARRVRIQEETSEERKRNAQLVEEAREFLKELLGEEPNWLSIPRSFVAMVSVEELRAIAASSLFKAIHPNRQLR